MLSTDIAKRMVLGGLNEQLQKQGGICRGFVVMPNHVHAILHHGRPDWISPFMGKWKEQTSKRLKDLYRREFPNYARHLAESDSFWQAKYYGFNLYSPTKFVEKLDYMHRNPCAEHWALAERATDYRFSSARYWILGKPVGVPLSLPEGLDLSPDNLRRGQY